MLKSKDTILTGIRSNRWRKIEAVEWSGLNLAAWSNGSLQLVSCEGILVDHRSSHDHFQSVACSCMIPRWPITPQPASWGRLAVFLFNFFTSGLRHRVLWKEIDQIKGLGFGVQFPIHNRCDRAGSYKLLGQGLVRMKPKSFHSSYSLFG